MRVRAFACVCVRVRACVCARDVRRRYSAEVLAALDLPKPTNVLCAMVWPSEAARRKGCDAAIGVIELFGRMSTKPFTGQDEVKLNEWAAKFGALLSCVQLSAQSLRRIGRVDDVEAVFFAIRNYMSASAAVLMDAGRKMSSMNELQVMTPGVTAENSECYSRKNVSAANPEH